MNILRAVLLLATLIHIPSYAMEEKRIKKSKTWPSKKKSRIVSIKESQESGDPLDLKALLDTLPLPPSYSSKPSRFKLSPSKKEASKTRQPKKFNPLVVLDDSFRMEIDENPESKKNDWDPEDKGKKTAILTSALPLKEKKKLLACLHQKE